MSKPKGAMGTEAAMAKETSQANFWSNALDNYTNNINESQNVPAKRAQEKKKQQEKSEQKVKITKMFDKDIKQELLEILVSNKLNIIQACDDIIIFETKNGNKMVIVPAEEE